MAKTVVELYRDVSPKTNCGECGVPTCLAFASKVVLEKQALDACPYLTPKTLAELQPELDAQHETGKHLKRDLAADALEWAKQKAASMKLEDLAERIGGELKQGTEGVFLELPYFAGAIHIGNDTLLHPDGTALGRWEQVFIYNHMAQGGSAEPIGEWKGLELIPNTTPKLKSMQEHVEKPLLESFRGQPEALLARAKLFGGQKVSNESFSSDLAIKFRPLPKVPILLLFWDEDPEEGFEARVKLLFDETISEHLDIESIMFLSERLRQLLRGDEAK